MRYAAAAALKQAAHGFDVGDSILVVDASRFINTPCSYNKMLIW